MDVVCLPWFWLSSLGAGRHLNGFKLLLTFLFVLIFLKETIHVQYSQSVTIQELLLQFDMMHWVKCIVFLTKTTLTHS